MLLDFIALNSDEIVRRTRERAATRLVPPPSEAELDHGIPLFLSHLVERLRLDSRRDRDTNRRAGAPDRDFWPQRFTLSQVVLGYGEACRAITELAVEQEVQLDAKDLRRLSQCLEQALAAAVNPDEPGQHPSAADGTVVLDHERLGSFVHELRNLLHTSMVAFEVLKTTHAGALGNTGTILYRSLVAARDLVARVASGPRHEPPAEHDHHERVHEHRPRTD